MTEDLSPLEELKKKLAAEDLSERLKRGALIPDPPSEDEVKAFLDEVFREAFDQIKTEIEKYFKNVKYRVSSRAISLNVTEKDSSSYRCRFKINRRRGKVEFESEYKYPISKNIYFEGKWYYHSESIIGLGTVEIRFGKLSEITQNQIIKIFSESFFQRIKKKEEYETSNLQENDININSLEGESS